MCLKHGDKYSSQYVNVLYNMVKRHTTVPHKFVCFTEDTNGIDPNVECLPLPDMKVTKGWWFKPLFFNPDLLPEGTRLFLDLDLVIFNNIDNLFTYEPGKFCIIRDFNRFQQPNWNRMNSSVFRLDYKDQAHVYKEFVRDPVQHIRRFHGDQDFIFSQVKNNFAFWPDEWIQSYKWEMRGKPPMTRLPTGRNFVEPGEPKILPNTSVAVFHGDPNPHNCIDEWPKQHWR